jgi:NAD(P)-dependent dehydrogenase (short-subunit alcohol dehydrogenase family)
VNNAGIFKTQKSEEARLDLWQTQMQVNLLSAVQITEGLIPFLVEAKPGWILNISSSLATKPSQNVGAYGATKAAMNHWTQTLAIELGTYQVRVNAICPGIVDTPIHGFHHLPETEKQQQIEKLKNLQPLGRIGEPSDVAKAARYLCSEKASWVTGAILNVDGGVNLL